MSKLFELTGASLAFLAVWIVVTIIAMFGFGSVCPNCPPATAFPYALGGLGFVVSALVFGIWKLARGRGAAKADVE